MKSHCICGMTETPRKFAEICKERKKQQQQQQQQERQQHQQCPLDSDISGE